MYKSLLLSVVGLLVSVLPSVGFAQLFAPQASQDAALTSKPANQCEDQRDDCDKCESESTITFFFNVPERLLLQRGVTSEVERWRFCITPPYVDTTTLRPVFNLQGFNFQKEADNASPRLLQALVTPNNPIGTVVLTVKFGRQTITYTFTNVLITNYSQAVVKECEEPVEDITFTYESLRVQYNNGQAVIIGGPSTVSGAK